VRNIALFNAAVIVVLVAYATAHGLTWSAIIPLIPHSDTCSHSSGVARDVHSSRRRSVRVCSELGVLPTGSLRSTRLRLSMSLCDKTGTLTKEQIVGRQCATMSGYDEASPPHLATLASGRGRSGPRGWCYS